MLKDSEYARGAYANLRLQIVPGGKPMPDWFALNENEREILIRMFILGAEHACAEILRPKTVTRGRVSS